MDHFCLCGLLGQRVWAALRLLSQIYPPELALDYEFGRSLARRDRGWFRNARWSGRWRGAGAAPEKLRLSLSRAMEHAAGIGVPVHRAGAADRHRSWREQAHGPIAWGPAMTASTSGYALEVINLKKAFGGLTATQNVSLSIRPGERRLI